MTISDIMSSPVETIFPNASIEQAARIMEDKKVHRLLVLDKDNHILGILSITDLARKSRDEHLLHGVLEKVCEPSHGY